MAADGTDLVELLDRLEEECEHLARCYRRGFKESKALEIAERAFEAWERAPILAMRVASLAVAHGWGAEAALLADLYAELTDEKPGHPPFDAGERRWYAPLGRALGYTRFAIQLLRVRKLGPDDQPGPAVPEWVECAQRDVALFLKRSPNYNALVIRLKRMGKLDYQRTGARGLKVRFTDPGEHARFAAWVERRRKT